MEHVYNDGGRLEAGFRGHTGDCVVRAVSIAAGLPYQLVYDDLSDGCRTQRLTKRSKRKASARSGVNVRRKWFREYMESLGFRWTPTMQVGQGCKVHLRADELPHGRIIVSLSRHYAAVIDGVLHDTDDCSRDGTRCVYGYWSAAPSAVADDEPTITDAQIEALRVEAGAAGDYDMAIACGQAVAGDERARAECARAITAAAAMDDEPGFTLGGAA